MSLGLGEGEGGTPAPPLLPNSTPSPKKKEKNTKTKGMAVDTWCGCNGMLVLCPTTWKFGFFVGCLAELFDLAAEPVRVYGSWLRMAAMRQQYAAKATSEGNDESMDDLLVTSLFMRISATCDLLLVVIHVQDMYPGGDTVPLWVPQCFQ